MARTTNKLAKPADRTPRKQRSRSSRPRLTLAEAADRVIDDRREVLKELEKH